MDTKQKLDKQTTNQWAPNDAAELYHVPRWGKGYFEVGKDGHVWVHPTKDPEKGIDLKKLVDTLTLRGIQVPILLRFPEILQQRVRDIHGAFATAMTELEYNGGFRCVYPIKVNQQRQVVQEIYEHGRAFGFGLEAGSKPELLAVLAIADNDTPIICNGFKDDEYIQTAMLARKIGRQIVPVVEKYSELDLIIRNAAEIGVNPAIGIRIKLASRGAGRWKKSGGYRSKFGLTVTEAQKALEQLRELRMMDSLQLLHFHLGSQITNIRVIKAGVTEAARVYAELKRSGAGLQYLDVGGGLGVDYDGSQTDFESSVNYTLQEYANDVVHHIQHVCDDAEVEHPTIVIESGRAIAAHHSVLVFNVVGVTGPGDTDIPKDVPDSCEQPVIDLRDTYRDLTSRNLIESSHDAQQALDSALNLFSLGYLPMTQRCVAENLYWAICRRIQKLAAKLEYYPEELEGLDRMLSEIYFCNFSLFQSIPDSWAVKQLFPVMPIHRLRERPTRHAVLADVSCDSDGKIDQFIDRRDVKKTLLLHKPDSEPYLMGAFLVGAYQEILGDLHNLFGDTNAVHVRTGDTGEPVLEAVVRGDTVQDVLEYVAYSARSLVSKFREDVEGAVREGRFGYEEAGRLVRYYEDGLQGYTYLEERQDR